MAKQVKLTAERRTGTGRSAVRKIKGARRSAGGHLRRQRQSPNRCRSRERDITAMLSHASGENILVELEIDGDRSQPPRARAGSAACPDRRRYFACRFPRGLDGRNDRGRSAARADRHGRRREELSAVCSSKASALARDRVFAEGSAGS